jgi:hypothetical protein
LRIFAILPFSGILLQSYTDEQPMSAREDCGHDSLDDFTLADDAAQLIGMRLRAWLNSVTY